MFASGVLGRLGSTLLCQRPVGVLGHRSASSNPESRSKQKPAIRPHILRDIIREKKIKHSIRKVTGGSAEEKSAYGSIKATDQGEKQENTTLGVSKISPQFHKLKLFGPLLRAIDDAGFKDPTPIQTQLIPLALRGHNIAASAQTGTGKTAAYTLPLLQQIHAFKLNEEKQKISRESAPLAIIVCPTRELCEQVEMQIYRLAVHINGLRIVGLQGASKNVDAQIKAIQKGVDILVSTPGRLVALMKPRDKGAELNKAADVAKSEGKSMIVIDDDKIYEEIEIDEDDDMEEREEAADIEEGEEEFEDDEDDDLTKKIGSVDMNPEKTKRQETKKRRKSIEPPAPKRFIIDMSHVRHFVLDEVDRMFAMGNFAEIKAVFDNLPKARAPSSDGAKRGVQVLMLSATLVPRMRDLIRRFAPQHTIIDLNKAMQAASDVSHQVFAVGARRKKGLLVFLLKNGIMKEKQALIFCRTRQRVERLVEQLAESGIVAQGLHGEQPVGKRRAIVDAFLKNEFRILISTDLLARGIDIPNLPFVVNYDLPHNPEDYVHRVGRTGRAGAPGHAISIISREPTTINLRGKIVELDEKAFLDQISNFLGKKLKLSKLPAEFEDKGKKEDEQDLKKSSEKSGNEEEEDDDENFDDEDQEQVMESESTKGRMKGEQGGELPAPASSKEKKMKYVGMPGSIDDLFVKKNPAAPQEQQKSGTKPRERSKPREAFAPIDESDPLLKQAAAEFKEAREAKIDVDRAKNDLVRKLSDKAKRVGATSTNNEPIENFPRKLLRRRLSRKQRLELFAATVKTKPSLRDFRQGRYEDVIKDFDARKARKMGVHVPPDFEERIEQKRKKIEKRKKREDDKKQARKEETAMNQPKKFKIVNIRR